MMPFSIYLLIYFKLFSLVLTLNHNNNSSNRSSPTENSHLHLFQGDILFRSASELLTNQKSKAVPYRDVRWPDSTVYYTLDTSFYSEEEIDVIKSAMEEFEHLTCIKWKERTDEENFVEIENDFGCSSEVGMHEGGQSIFLEAPNCIKKGVIIHEMMHALGFVHEMSRPDRDEYIDVQWNHIIPGMQENFVKMLPQVINDFGLPYDYKSIMHYQAWAFSDDGVNPTSTPKDPNIPLTDLGKGLTEGTFSENDLIQINLFYQC